MSASGAIQACLRFAAAGVLSSGAGACLLGSGLPSLDWVAIPLLLSMVASQVAAIIILTSSALARAKRLGVVRSMLDRPSPLKLWKDVHGHPLAKGLPVVMKAGWALGGLGLLLGCFKRVVLDPRMGRDPGEPFFVLPVILMLFFTFHALAEFGVMQEREGSDPGPPNAS